MEKRREKKQGYGGEKGANRWMMVLAALSGWAWGAEQRGS